MMILFQTKVIKSRDNLLSIWRFVNSITIFEIINVCYHNYFVVKLNCQFCEKMPIAPLIKLNNGRDMPVLGLGTYLVRENI